MVCNPYTHSQTPWCGTVALQDLPETIANDIISTAIRLRIYDRIMRPIMNSSAEDDNRYRLGTFIMKLLDVLQEDKAYTLQQIAHVDEYPSRSESFGNVFKWSCQCGVLVRSTITTEDNHRYVYKINKTFLGNSRRRQGKKRSADYL